MKYEINQITEMVIGAAIKVHRALGPGLLESAYEACLCYELSHLGLKFRRQKDMPLTYEDVKLDCGYRIDVWIEDRVLLELKAVDELAGIHEAQILTYMKLSGCSVGLLINFNVRLLKDGIKRFKL